MKQVEMKFVHESNKINRIHHRIIIQMTTNGEKCDLSAKIAVSLRMKKSVVRLSKSRVHVQKKGKRKRNENERKRKEITFICGEMMRISIGCDLLD